MNVLQCAHVKMSILFFYIQICYVDFFFVYIMQYTACREKKHDSAQYVCCCLTLFTLFTMTRQQWTKRNRREVIEWERFHGVGIYAYKHTHTEHGCHANCQKMIYIIYTIYIYAQYECYEQKRAAKSWVYESVRVLKWHG